MKRFLIKTTILLLPIIIILSFSLLFHTTDKGDLIRIGYIMDIYPSYRKMFDKELENKVRFTKFSERNKDERDYDILIIGDSFSNQGNTGYQNYMNEKGNLNILYLDVSLSENPIQTLWSLVNSNLFEEYNFRYVILQSIERHVVTRSQALDTLSVFSLEDIDASLLDEGNNELIKPSSTFNKALLMPYYCYVYLSGKDYHFPNVYRVATNKSLFSVNRNELLFFEADIENLSANNDIDKVRELNDAVNTLSDKLNINNCKLLFLVAPDKYDAYYNFITNKDLYPEPLFFNMFDEMEKKYLYINLKQSFLQEKGKDIYYYDDTHWSPIGSRIVANKLLELTSSFSQSYPDSLSLESLPIHDAVVTYSQPRCHLFTTLLLPIHNAIVNR